MKKIFALIFSLLMVFTISTVLAEENENLIEIPVGTEIYLKDDCVIQLEVARTDGSCDCGVGIYTQSDPTARYLFRVRWNDDKRVDFYGAKDKDSRWIGFLIGEENMEWLKDCYVSVDEGWDATTDPYVILTIKVEGSMAYVTMEGAFTGKKGSLTFDLTKSPWLDFEEKEADPLVLTEGYLSYAYNGGTILSVKVDEDTYNAYYNASAPVVEAAEDVEEIIEVADAEVEAEGEYKYVEVPIDADVYVSGKFSVRTVVHRVDGRLDGGIAICHNRDTNSDYAFKVRWLEDRRADFYGVKDVNGAWKGFLIGEENMLWLKDCYVSVDEGWDTTADTKMILTVTVEDGFAYVTMKGDVTGKEGTLTFDLSKSPWLDWEEKEAAPELFTEGYLGFQFNGGEALQLFVDEATYAANFSVAE